MSRNTILKLFVGSVIGLVVGTVLVGVGALVTYADGAWLTDGSDVVGFRTSPLSWTMIGLAIAGAVILVAAAVAALVSWIGALVKTVNVPDKTWFVILLVTGLLSVGFVGMIVYLIAGPRDAPTATASVELGLPVAGPMPPIPGDDLIGTSVR